MVKVSRLPWVSTLFGCALLLGCGDAGGSSEVEIAHTIAVPANSELPGGGGPNDSTTTGSGGASLGGATANGGAESEGSDVPEADNLAECPDPCSEQNSCGQICISMTNRGSSCQLAPTANDLSRPPRSVRFDCHELTHGPNGYDYDSQGHVLLTGATCEAAKKGGPHRVALILACPLDQ